MANCSEEEGNWLEFIESTESEFTEDVPAPATVELERTEDILPKEFTEDVTASATVELEKAEKDINKTTLKNLKINYNTKKQNQLL